jgi:hypothetical protein
MMIKKHLSYLLFLITLFYIISPWFFERFLLFNEILSASGFLILAYKKFRIGRDAISISVLGLFLWGVVHMISSLFRMDSLYFYLRNLVIIYSMMTFFIGFYCLPYLQFFLDRSMITLRGYVGIFLFIPLPRYLFERFGMSMLFPSFFYRSSLKWVPWILILINLIYGITYSSLTAWIIAAFYFLLFISPGYKFFKQTLILFGIAFIFIFIYLIPYLSIIALRYSPFNSNGILDVMHSNQLLRIDGNSTWRLVLWKQVLVDHFPANLIGIGFGTPMFKYYPIEDISKLKNLPYVLGAHNSFVYLFGRLGLPYLLFVIVVYSRIFKEYFYFKSYYFKNNQILIFWSFTAATIIALFNPALESPIYSGAYWLILGLTARSIYNRQYPVNSISGIPAIDS